MLDLTNLDTIKNIIKENRLWPKKGYGQNFLIARHPLISLIDSAEISADDVIVEIGPGLGTLTQELAARAKLVLAIESDYKLVEYLRRYFKGAKNVKIIHQDTLTYDLGLIIDNYKLVSNLPYNITSPVIRKFLETENRPSEMVLMVQKEVAERLTAKPGSADRGILTVMVELFGGVYPDLSRPAPSILEGVCSREGNRGAEIVEIVPRGCFYPVPKVDSAIIKLQVTHSTNSGQASYKLQVDPRLLMKFVKVGFSQKRRQIHHPLSANLHLPNKQIKDILKLVEIDPTNRAEDLTIEEWIKLYSGIKLRF